MTVTIGNVQTDLPTFVRPALPPSAARAQADFASILGIAERVVQESAPDPTIQAREAAEQFVAKVFIEPALAIARESSDLPPPLGAGSGEKQFASLIDAQRALEMVRSSDWPIVDRLVRDMTRAGERERESGLQATSRGREPAEGSEQSLHGLAPVARRNHIAMKVSVSHGTLRHD